MKFGADGNTTETLELLEFAERFQILQYFSNTDSREVKDKFGFK